MWATGGQADLLATRELRRARLRSLLLDLSALYATLPVDVSVNLSQKHVGRGGSDT